MTDLPRTVRTERGWSVEGAGPDLLSSLLPVLRDELAARNPDCAHYFLPGLPRDDVISSLTAVGLPAHEEAIRIWTWADGVDFTVNSFVGRFLPLDWVTRMYHDEPFRGDDAVIDPDDPALDIRYMDNWMRWTQGGGGLAAHVTPDDEPPIIRVIDAAQETNPPPGSLSNDIVSFCTPVVWWIEMMRQEIAVFNTATGSWEVDMPREIKLWHTLD